MNSGRFETLNTGSTGVTSDDGRLVATSALRNVDAICAVLSSYVPATGHALEIASGSGQHVARFAAEFPQVVWQPSDIDPAKIASIQSWIAAAGATNIAEPIVLDAGVPGWADQQRSFDLIVMVNLLHLISQREAEAVIAGAAQALSSDGTLIIYGPFKRGDAFASEGDERFHHALSAQDADIGYKSFQCVQDMQRSCGLEIRATHQMPANNLMLVAAKR